MRFTTLRDVEIASFVPHAMSLLPALVPMGTSLLLEIGVSTPVVVAVFVADF